GDNRDSSDSVWMQRSAKWNVGRRESFKGGGDCTDSERRLRNTLENNAAITEPIRTGYLRLERPVRAFQLPYAFCRSLTARWKSAAPSKSVTRTAGGCLCVEKINSSGLDVTRISRTSLYASVPAVP